MMKPRKSTGSIPKTTSKGSLVRLSCGLETAKASLDVVMGRIQVLNTGRVAAVNTCFMEGYCSNGELAKGEMADAGSRKRTVRAPAEYIRWKQRNVHGYSASNLWRMIEFFQTYGRRPANGHRPYENCLGGTTCLL
jgi:hypothetical protein